jgi:hypothetical protein
MPEYLIKRQMPPTPYLTAQVIDGTRFRVDGKGATKCVCSCRRVCSSWADVEWLLPPYKEEELLALSLAGKFDDEGMRKESRRR